MRVCSGLQVQLFDNNLSSLCVFTVAYKYNCLTNTCENSAVCDSSLGFAACYDGTTSGTCPSTFFNYDCGTTDSEGKHKVIAYLI